MALADTAKAPEIPGWKLLWHDEFDGSQIDTTKWRVENAALIKNRELQYYSPDEVFVKDGVLTLRTQKRIMYGRRYTSGLVETKGKFSFQFGRVEVRAKLPKTQGIWPAHWMLPDNGKWPPEIDIMEALGHEPGKVYFTHHWGTREKHKWEQKYFEGADFSKDFHVFAIEWEADHITWFVDGQEVHTTRQRIPDVPFYIILNTAVGGDWPGNPGGSTEFPQTHDIDYVRVYQRV